MERYVYLAGGITGSRLEDIVAWRDYVASKLDNHIIPLSPLRLKRKYLKDLIEDGIVAKEYNQKKLSSGQGIYTRDVDDIRRSDLVFCNFLGTNIASLGTGFEIGLASAWQKPLVIVAEENNIHRHPLLVRNALVTDSLDEGIELINGILGYGV